MTVEVQLALETRTQLAHRTPMIRVPPATLANPKPDAALGAALGSEEKGQTKTNNQHTKLDRAMPVRTPQ